MSLYEEDVLSMGHVRVAQWREMEAYAAALPAGGRASAPGAGPRESFARLLGYPAPGFRAEPELRLEPAGEDGVATYYRCRVAAAGAMETYGLYIVPKGRRGPAPLVIAMHGGGGFPELATFQGGSNYHDLVRGAVAEGYVAYAPLAVMHPFRDRDHGTPIPADVRERLDARLKEGGTTLMGVEVTKIAQALGLLLRRPEIDPKRVAMIGLSYGGFYTLYAAAVDPRIRVAVASCSFWSPPPPGAPPDGRPEETKLLPSWELAALVSPRALQAQCGIRDEIYPIAGARAAAERSKAAYAGLLAGNFDFEAFDGGHEFCGRAAWPFLRKHLGAG